MLRRLTLGLVATSVVLSVPACPRTQEVTAPTPFRWDAADLFAVLEGDFTAARSIAFTEAARTPAALEVQVREILRRVGESTATPTEDLTALAELQFNLAVIGAAHPELLAEVEALIREARVTVMHAAADWPADRVTHEALYRVIFGGRIALEEALIQAGPDALPQLIEIEDVQSETPSLVVEGVRIHSGDILLSRGGAPTSALIARGSDFANTFSHAALAHVDPETGVGTVVESLIETGSVLSTVEDYLQSKKHRILVLRPRPDHPAVLADPQLPHRAATRMLERLRSQHVPYDFGMHWSDETEMFCSEIVFHAYEPEGLHLWPLRSAMTTPGLVRWLGAMGVQEFRTLVPSDLEYDAQLRAVVEWRDVAALMDYRLDNAITDVLLEAADEGADLGYAWYALPLARLLKVYSVAQSWVGAQPKIPSGMPPGAALRVSALVSTVSPAIKADLMEREARFFRENGFRAPYWELVELARSSYDAVRVGLGPALRDSDSDS